jgi:hypothetical protein
MTERLDDLAWLCDWYAGNCDGDWEHEFGIAIETLDNPGWSIRIDLTRTTSSAAALPAVDVENDDGWMRMWKDEERGVLNGACSPTLLPRMLSLFREWAAAN